MEIVLISVFALLFLGLVLSQRSVDKIPLKNLSQEGLFELHQRELHSRKLFEKLVEAENTPQDILNQAADLSKASTEATNKWRLRNKKWL